jgi:hypothetical protein
MNQGDVIDIELRVESTEWGEPIHVHFNTKCPVCNKSYAGTTMYDSPIEYIDDTFNCGECDSEFKLLSYKFGDAIVEVIKVNVNER